MRPGLSIHSRLKEKDKGRDRSDQCLNGGKFLWPPKPDLPSCAV